MLNKLMLSGIAFFLGSTLHATPFFVQDIEKFFNNDSFFSTPYNYYKLQLSTTYPKMNLFQEDKRYIFEFELAGIDKKDINVTITDKNILTISGTKKRLSKEEKKNIIKQERYYGSFSRTISLPDDINAKKIKITYKEGILKIIIEKILVKMYGY